MKASCRACARSYSVSDERIEGLTGRFRCKCGALVRVDGRSIARASPALWAVEVSTTDRRWLTLDEMITSWVSGLLPGEALAGHDGEPWRQRIRDLPEVRARLGVARIEPLPWPLVSKKPRAARSEPAGFPGGAEPDSAGTIVEALTRYAEEGTAPDAPRVETLAPSSVVGVARDVGDPPRSWMSLLGVGAATVAVAASIFLWRTADLDAPAAPAADRPVSLGADAPSHAPVPPAPSASASAPDPSGSAARLRTLAPVERRSR